MAGKTTNLQLQKIDNTDYAGNFPTIYNNNLDLIDVLNNKQDKLIAGSGITIASDGKTISSSGKKWKLSNKSIFQMFQFNTSTGLLTVKHFKILFIMNGGTEHKTIEIQPLKFLVKNLATNIYLVYENYPTWINFVISISSDTTINYDNCIMDYGSDRYTGKSSIDNIQYKNDIIDISENMSFRFSIYE